jgi:hypothetical protein
LTALNSEYEQTQATEKPDQHCESLENINEKTGMVAHACNPSYSVGSGKRQSYSVILSEKQTENKRTGRVAQVAVHLPSKHEALSSNPTTHAKKFIHFFE